MRKVDAELDVPSTADCRSILLRLTTTIRLDFLRPSISFLVRHGILAAVDWARTCIGRFRSARLDDAFDLTPQIFHLGQPATECKAPARGHGGRATNSWRPPFSPWLCRTKPVSPMAVGTCAAHFTNLCFKSVPIPNQLWTVHEQVKGIFISRLSIVRLSSSLTALRSLLLLIRTVRTRSLVSLSPLLFIHLLAPSSA
ncbi:hypothetical protein CC80DRAFT_143200 [Byssothecium circinans]|uniref:Uncharacterized protein n=1 Tax=Byssothecium circinans TaxID=147558 RepID=A0A6A5TSE2_9PLEO|nr:hypothetical protein CC80DRAFT_143200 [Byssothecium circinans]